MAASLPAAGASRVHPGRGRFLDSRSVDDPLTVSQRWWDEIWRDGKLDAIDALFTDPLTRHTGSGSETVQPQGLPRAAWPRPSASCSRVQTIDRRPGRRR